MLGGRASPPAASGIYVENRIRARMSASGSSARSEGWLKGPSSFDEEGQLLASDDPEVFPGPEIWAAPGRSAEGGGRVTGKLAKARREDQLRAAGRTPVNFPTRAHFAGVIRYSKLCRGQSRSPRGVQASCRRFCRDY